MNDGWREYFDLSPSLYSDLARAHELPKLKTELQENIRGLSTLYRVSPITGLVAYRPTSFFVRAGRFQNFLIVSWASALGLAAFY